MPKRTFGEGRLLCSAVPQCTPLNKKHEKMIETARKRTFFSGTYRRPKKFRLL